MIYTKRTGADSGRGRFLIAQLAGLVEVAVLCLDIAADPDFLERSLVLAQAEERFEVKFPFRSSLFTFRCSPPPDDISRLKCQFAGQPFDKVFQLC